MRALWIAIVNLVALSALGCVDPVEPLIFAQRDFRQFQREVYPVLLRDCAFPTCHGGDARFFRVYGPGRTRLETLRTVDGVEQLVLPDPFDVPTIEEQQASFAFAKSMIEERDTKASLLLRKPLSVEAGGAGHRGVDSYGRDVYRTTQDSGYVTLARWVFSPPPMAATP